MPVTLAYSSDAVSRAHRRGWGAFDAMVLWAASQQPAATFGDVIRLLPDGVHLRQVSIALRGLVAAGLLDQGRMVADGQITVTYTAAPAADTRKAA